MKTKKLRTMILVSLALIVFALAFSVVGLLTPSEEFDSIDGFGKIFAASPEFDFESGSFVTSFGDFSFSVNFTFEKPFLSLLSDGPVIHINFIIVIAILCAMIVSCIVPEISFGTSGVVAILVGICTARLGSLLREGIVGDVSSWDVAAGGFWFLSFLFTVLIVNGVIGIGGKIIGAVIISEKAKVIVTLLVSLLLANAISLIICLFAYLTVGLGWCGGVMLWFIISILLVVFMEIMDIISL